MMIVKCTITNTQIKLDNNVDARLSSDQLFMFLKNICLCLGILSSVSTQSILIRWNYHTQFHDILIGICNKNKNKTTLFANPNHFWLLLLSMRTSLVTNSVKV